MRLRLRRWGVLIASGSVVLAIVVIFGNRVRQASAPSLRAGTVASLALDLEAIPGRQTQAKMTTADRDKIEALAAVLRMGKPTGDHKCAGTGTLTFRMNDGSSSRIELLAGHDRRYYEFRAGSGGTYGVYRVDRQPMWRATSGLGAGSLDPGA